MKHADQVTREDRLQEIRDAFEDTTILRDRHRADPAIGELLAEVDRLTSMLERVPEKARLTVTFVGATGVRLSDGQWLDRGPAA